MGSLAATLPLLFSAGCALPISLPMAPLSAASQDRTSETIVTGAIGAQIDDDGVAERLGAESWAAARAALVRAAERGEDGERFAWRSASGHVSGTVVAVSAYLDADGDVCRHLEIAPAKPDQSGRFRAAACRLDAGRWQIAPVPDEE